MPLRQGKSSSRPKGGRSLGQLQEIIKWVDLVIEVRDSRAPITSAHPQSEKIFGNKPRIIILTKKDLADSAKAGSRISSRETPVVSLSLKQQQGKDALIQLALKLTASKRDSLKKKGVLNRPMRICVVGMPNVGKSSLINWLIGKKKTAVADRPGVTRGRQWVRVHPQLELLDTPGILPPFKFKPESELKLSLLNLVSASTYNQYELAEKTLEIMHERYPNLMEQYIGSHKSAITLADIAIAKNFVTSGGKPDVARAAGIFIADIRNGKLGKIMLD